jgi:cysteine-rich repeat protein
MFKHILHGFCIGIVSVVTLTACGTGPNAGGDRGQGADEANVGSLSMKLRTDVNGIGYRLRQGLFDVSGPNSATLDTEIDPDASVIAQTLPVGNYVVSLQPGWSLERQFNGVFQTVQAELLTSNPQAFAITANGTTNVNYEFQTDGTLVDLGQGNLDVGIQVVDTTNPVCGNGVLEQGEMCDDGNASNVDTCSTTCTTCTQLAGPSLPRPLAGWPNSGLEFDALANATLFSFVFHNQGAADQITLSALSGGIVGSVSIPAGSDPNLVVNVNWPLAAGTSYILTSANGNNGFWEFFGGFPVTLGAIQVDATWGAGAPQTGFWFTFTDLATCLQ